MRGGIMLAARLQYASCARLLRIALSRWSRMVALIRRMQMRKCERCDGRGRVECLGHEEADMPNGSSTRCSPCKGRGVIPETQRERDELEARDRKAWEEYEKKNRW